MTQEAHVRLAPVLARELDGCLRSVPVEGRLHVQSSDAICSTLELFVPAALRQMYPEWDVESLDGFFFCLTEKVADNAADMAGTCILISDQTVTPFRLALTIGPSVDSVRYSIRLGEPGAGALGISGPPCNSNRALDLLHGLPGRLSTVRWVYKLDSDLISVPSSNHPYP